MSENLEIFRHFVFLVNHSADEMNDDAKTPNLCQTSYFPAIYQKYNHTVLLMENHLSINKVVTISFRFYISEFLKPSLD